eukprot:2189794-Alexandrium_andersonii.AAC.1
MSASLVGSEMCIRDRHPLSLARRLDVYDRELGQGGIGRQDAKGRGGDAVSYTHLTLPTICSV